MTIRSVAALATCALSLLVASGCDITVEGEEGALFFQYDVEGFHTFRQDVAVGTRAAVQVFSDEEATEPAAVDAVTFDPEGILSLDGTADNAFTVQALSAGATTLTVSSGAASDRVEMEAADVAAVELREPNPFTLNEGAVAFLQGGTARIPFTLMDDGEDHLVGYGLDGFTATPEGAAAFESAPDVNFLHVTFAQAGAVSLGHPLGEPFEVTVVPTADVASLAWNAFGADDQDLEPGKVALLMLVAEAADGTTHLYGTEGAVAVDASPSAVCSIAHSALWGDSSYEVVPLGSGTCTVEATLGELSATVELTVVDSGDGY